MKAKHLLLLLVLLICSCSHQKQCKIEGRIIDTPEAVAVLLTPYNSDYRTTEPIEIAVNLDGTFSYTLPCESLELYSLALKHEVEQYYWRIFNIMLEDGTVDITIYPNDDAYVYSYEVKGGELNDRFFYLDRDITTDADAKISKLYDVLYEEMGDSAYTPEYLQFSAEFEKLADIETLKDSLIKVRDELIDNNMMFTDEGNEIIAKAEQLQQEANENILSEIRKNPDEATLAILYQFVVRNEYRFDVEKSAIYKDILYSVFCENYSKNPMYIKAEKTILAREVVVGSKFADFMAPDLNGNMYKLSELIKGKVVVLDLWASWCGPCIRKSISFIPIWEKYKDKGFDIIGVAREKNNTAAMEQMIEEVGMPWLNLVELQDRANIWAKYSAGNAGGKVILIDANGVIVDIDFDAKELESHLDKLLR